MDVFRRTAVGGFTSKQATTPASVNALMLEPTLCVRTISYRDSRNMTPRYFSTQGMLTTSTKRLIGHESYQDLDILQTRSAKEIHTVTKKFVPRRDKSF